ncbi:DM13 domain-containing protein [Yoonia sp. R2331]|uniref:DM13 domain-containing protein n=1 Tax=Yoonia sp. R2331 TaxID=3237238 RepID=UPI0034E4BAA9
MHRRTFIAAGVSMFAAPALAGGHGRLGQLEGRSTHTSSGTAEIAGDTVSLLDDFFLDNAPDPVVGLGKDGTYDPNTFMGELKAMRGGSTYTVPAGINTDDYNEVYVWCRAANVPLSVARVN